MTLPAALGLPMKVWKMNCNEVEILLHGLVDNEVSGGQAYRIKTHVEICERCAAQLRLHRTMRAIMSKTDLRFAAPPALRPRIRAMLAAAGATSRRTLFKGIVLGSALCAAVAALLMIAVIRSDQDQVIVSDVVSAHLRSLQAEHLTDLQASDERAVKPWFENRLGVAPPVPDLSSQGFSLIGGRIDYVLGKAVAAIVYRRSDHVINVFVAQGADAPRSVRVDSMQGYNVEIWSNKGLNLCAVADLSAEELEEFRRRFETAAWAGQV